MYSIHTHKDKHQAGHVGTADSESLSSESHTAISFYLLEAMKTARFTMRHNWGRSDANRIHKVQ